MRLLSSQNKIKGFFKLKAISSKTWWKPDLVSPNKLQRSQTQGCKSRLNQIERRSIQLKVLNI